MPGFRSEGATPSPLTPMSCPPRPPPELSPPPWDPLHWGLASLFCSNPSLGSLRAWLPPHCPLGGFTPCTGGTPSLLTSMPAYSGPEASAAARKHCSVISETETTSTTSPTRPGPWCLLGLCLMRPDQARNRGWYWCMIQREAGGRKARVGRGGNRAREDAGTARDRYADRQKQPEGMKGQDPWGCRGAGAGQVGICHSGSRGSGHTPLHTPPCNSLRRLPRGGVLGRGQLHQDNVPERCSDRQVAGCARVCPSA